MIGSINSSNLPGMLSRPQEALRALKSGPAEGLLKPITIGTGESTGSGAPSFAKTLESAVQAVDEKMKVAESDKSKLLTGETNNLHQAMISVQESSVAFSLMVEVRNKLVESYQELMRMQV